MERLPYPVLSRRALFAALGAILVPIAVACSGITAQAQDDPLPSWNDATAKQAILKFRSGDQPRRAARPSCRLAERIATFDQDGTLWVEHPMYSQVIYCLERVPALVAEKPELKEVEPFKTVLTGTARRSPSCRCTNWRRSSPQR